MEKRAEGGAGGEVSPAAVAAGVFACDFRSAVTGEAPESQRFFFG